MYITEMSVEMTVEKICYFETKCQERFTNLNGTEWFKSET